MPLHSDSSSSARIVYRLAGASLLGTAPVIGTLPVGYQILRASVKTYVAGTGSNAPTIAVGITGTPNKYVTAAALVVTAGVAAHTVIGTAIPTAAEPLIATLAGTAQPTNSDYAADLILELVRV